MSSSFHEKVQGMMARSGKPYWECCRILGARGGKAAAAAKRRRAQENRLQQVRRIK